MPENENPSPRNSRELSLEWQVQVLADRLAIVVSRLEDAELDSFCEGDEEAVTSFEREQALILLNNDAWKAIRQRERNNGLYKGALTKVRNMLDIRIREMRRAA